MFRLFLRVIRRLHTVPDDRAATSEERAYVEHLRHERILEAAHERAVNERLGHA